MCELYYNQISTGYSEIPGKITLNVFAQGCRLRCPGCHNQKLQEFNTGSTISLDGFIDKVFKNDLCKWVCWLGGDASYQPEFFFAANNRIKKDCKRKVCLYTGRLFQDVADEGLLMDVDMVVDGPWQGKPITDPDTNQQIYINLAGIWSKVTWKQLKDNVNII